MCLLYDLYLSFLSKLMNLQSFTCSILGISKFHSKLPEGDFGNNQLGILSWWHFKSQSLSLNTTMSLGWWRIAHQFRPPIFFQHELFNPRAHYWWFLSQKSTRFWLWIFSRYIFWWNSMWKWFKNELYDPRYLVLKQHIKISICYEV